MEKFKKKFMYQKIFIINYKEITLIPLPQNIKRINLIIAANEGKVISYSIYSNNTTKIEIINFLIK